MRLIDANSIMRKMADMLNESGNPLLAEKAIALIDHEPTAFDIKKVIQELNKNLQAAQVAKLLVRAELKIGISDDFSDGYYNGMKEALEIVDKGRIRVTEGENK